MGSLSVVTIQWEPAPTALAASPPLAAARPGLLQPLLNLDKAEDSPSDWIHSGGARQYGGNDGAGPDPQRQFFSSLLMSLK
jgi:DNA-binding transcriptional LysR family regulator